MVIVFIGIMFLVPFVSGAIPFGGPIITLAGCSDGVIWVTLGPPTPGNYMYHGQGTFSYSYGPPTHPGQWLLGHFGLPSPCQFGTFTVAVGPSIIYHGSSI
jgi:hypothetical protein